jgi:hypothetical protein
MRNVVTNTNSSLKLWMFFFPCYASRVTPFLCIKMWFAFSLNASDVQPINFIHISFHTCGKELESPFLFRQYIKVKQLGFAKAFQNPCQADSGISISADRATCYVKLA